MLPKGGMAVEHSGGKAQFIQKVDVRKGFAISQFEKPFRDGRGVAAVAHPECQITIGPQMSA
jgi:hypothetical protein